MDEKRSKILETLSTYIDAQNALLSRTVLDIERLTTLRERIDHDEDLTLEDVFADLKHPAFKLSAYADAVSGIPEGIDWDVFSNADPSPLRHLAARLEETRARRYSAPKTSQSGPSDLKALVKSAKTRLVEPTLAQFAEDYAAYSFSSSSEDEEDPVERRRRIEHDKIRELIRRRTSGGLTIRKDDISLRQDIEDESVEVEIAMDVDGEQSLSRPRSGKSAPFVLAKTPHKLPGARRNKRTAKAETEGALEELDPEGHTEATTPVSIIPETDNPTKKRRKKDKPRPETYKVPWTLSEQHLLEKLLEEIPDGEKNRWVKISKAMNGRRTSRQVASRVQKYLEKLKLFGLTTSEPSGK